jgi:DNA polymerase I-like protein with 3'-5' exonuclease and polymerase domains
MDWQSGNVELVHTTLQDNRRQVYLDRFLLGILTMNTQQLFESLNALSLRVKLRSDRLLEVVGDLSRLTDDMKTALQDNRQLFLNLLDQEAIEDFSRQSVRLGDRDFDFSIWQSGEKLRSPIAIDTETELIKDFLIPRIALASVSDGAKHRLIKPADLQAFIDQHAEAHFIAHNASFDFAVIRAALRDPIAWVEVADQGRLHDTMILDALIRLGRDDSYPQSRDLGTLAKVYLGVVINKDDPFRLRYAELLDLPWELADPGFFSYAIKDAIVTRKLWDVLSAIASDLIKPFAEELLPGASSRFGLLTESLQVRGAIALSQIERNGIALDQLQVEATKTKLSAEVERLIEQLQQMEATEGLFKLSKSRSLILTASGKPSTNQAKLIELLEAIAEDLDLEDVPRTGKTNKISSSIKFWGQYAERSPFLSLWVQLEEVAKLCQFFAGLKTDRIHPRYTTLVRTGRSSCHGPNIQQLPRAGGFREMIVPSPGSFFLGIDYAAIELRTLAAVCESRYGRSQLADVIKKGIDPHSFTASMFEGVSLEDFAKLPNRKQLRQQAKALNFGIPGGLGAASLVSYAAATYGVTMTIEQASSFRDRLIREVYSELSEYLKDDPVAALAHNLKTSAFRVRSCFDTDGALGAAKRIIAGKGKASGAGYGEAFVDRVWETLKTLNENRKLSDLIKNREAGDQLSRDLFFSPVATMTGRLRGKVGFAQSRNTPFQGLAADGAKLALWGLYRAGFRAVAFVHDEVLIELPIDADHTEQARRIDRILCETMEELTGSVPVACEFALSDRWYKAAEAVFDAKGKLQRWKPQN